MSRPSSVVVEETTTRVLQLKGWLRRASRSSPPGFPVGLQHGHAGRLVVGLRFRELGPLVAERFV